MSADVLLGSVILAVEGIVFFLLQEPDLVPTNILRMVANLPKSSRVRRYLMRTLKLWGTHVAGPILAVIAVVFVIASAFVQGDPTDASRVVRYSAWVTGIAAVLMVFRAQYDAWKEIDVELEDEKAKGEAAPHVDMTMHAAVLHGSMGLGVTDLFLNMTLVLGEPSSLSIQHFSLCLFDGTQTIEIGDTQDIEKWELVKKINGGLHRYICYALARELTRRGDPVQGWVHFPIPGMAESFLQRCMFRFEVNGRHGTCYFTFDGSYVHPDPDIKGKMRKRIAVETA